MDEGIDGEIEDGFPLEVDSVLVLGLAVTLNLFFLSVS